MVSGFSGFMVSFTTRLDLSRQCFYILYLVYKITVLQYQGSVLCLEPESGAVCQKVFRLDWFPEAGKEVQ